MAAVFGRLLPATLTTLFPLPKEAGSTAADNYDTNLSGALQNVINSIAALPTIRAPSNLAIGAQKALVSLFGRYQIEPIGAASTHPQLDTFRRLCDKYVFDTYGAENIIECGPSLTRMAARTDQCAAHSCSPNLDGRDRARAVLAAGIASKNPNHPLGPALVARGNMQWNQPAQICGNRCENCQVPGRVLYASFSLQDSKPVDLRRMMDAHNSSIALVALQIPVPLKYVDKFQEVDTGAIWKLSDDKLQATCYPGAGDAGYTHDMENLEAWLDFSDDTLFAEILYQYGSGVLFRFSRNGEEGGCSNYPLLIKTMLEKYAYIQSETPGIPSFLTSASHYERLVAYLTTHHDKFAGNLFKPALERISVLTPAIVLGDDKYSDRWVLSADERMSVALHACMDVQRMYHRTTLAQRKLNVINSQLATSARRAEANDESGWANWMLAKMRGEDTVMSERTFGDWIADGLDGLPGRTLAQTTALPALQRVNNGKAAARGDGPGNVEAPQNPPPPPQVAQQANRYVPARLGYPVPQNWWPAQPQFWLAGLQNVPQQRGARLLANFNPVANENVSQAAIRGQPANNLLLLQSRALNNWDWSVQAGIDILVVGPGGTGKSTELRRIAPAGTCVVVPTNELQTEWQRLWPGHAVYTLDEAVANINLVRAHPAIIIDEVYQFPVGHVITLASQNIPVFATGCPGQRRYNGPLGVGFSHALVPVDYFVACNTIYRYGQDVTDFMNRHIAPAYINEFGPLLPQNFQFVTANPGVNNIQRQLNQVNPALHLTFHNVDTNIYPGCITIDSSQGCQAADVYLHLFASSQTAFQQNPYALPLALGRTTGNITITVPEGTRQNSPLVQYMIRQGIPNDRLVRRRTGPNGAVFGSRYDPVAHGFTGLDDLDHEDADVPHANPNQDEIVPTQQEFLQYEILDDYCEESYEPCEEAFERPVSAVVPPGLAEALYELHPEPPNPADLHRDKTIVRFRKPDPRVRIRVPEWMATQDFTDPTIWHHIGYPFANTEVLASIVAVFDRYTKPQNVAIPNKRAFMLADIMFDRWMAAFIDPSRQVVVPSTAAMFKHWFSNAKALRIAQVAEQLPFIDSGRPLTNEYFLKCQCKPKFKAFGFCAECGQGILATNKLLNATTCPFIIAATKMIQCQLKKNVIYDSGYTADELDKAYRASDAFRKGVTKCLSVDLSQQDSSHTNVHRFFIAKVMAWLGFDDTIITLYLMSRARRFCKGLTILGLLFEVIERLFSGEPGTALFNWLMSGGTAACSHELANKLVYELLLCEGKGDDISFIPPPPRAKLAINMVKETGVIQKLDHYRLFDFANRIFTRSGVSFADPARMLAKFTMRMSGRENSHDEWQAFRDQKFVFTEEQRADVETHMVEKHKISEESASDIVSAVIALNDKATYFANLRPSKVPVDWMPILRKSGKHDVVFEDLNDQCAAAAIAFIADKPVSDVIAFVSRLRLVRPAHPDVRHRDMASKHPSPFHMDDWEVRQACTKFGVRLAGGELSLKQEPNHVVVVRCKLSWRTQRITDDSDYVFGSAHVKEIVDNSRASVVAAATFALQQAWLFFTCIPFFPNVFLSLPAYWSWSLSSFAWMLFIPHVVARILYYPFVVRRALTAHYKRPRAVRVEHAIYGSTARTGRKVDMWLIAIGLVVTLLLSWFIILNQWIMIDILSEGQNMFEAKMVFSFLGALGGFFFYQTTVQAFTLGCMFRKFDFSWYIIAPLLVSYVITMPWALPAFVLGFCFADYWLRTLRTIHFRLLALNCVSWGVVSALMTLVSLAAAGNRQRAYAAQQEREREYAEYLRFQQQEYEEQAKERERRFDEDSGKWKKFFDDWRKRNEEYWERTRQRWEEWENAGSRTQEPENATPHEKWINRCLHNAKRPAEKFCRATMKFCHPDKYATHKPECDAML